MPSWKSVSRPLPGWTEIVVLHIFFCICRGVGTRKRAIIQNHLTKRHWQDPSCLELFIMRGQCIQIAVRNGFWHNWQDKPHRYYLSLGLSYRRQTQGCSENCEEYMNMIWSPHRWYIQGRKRPPHSARTQRVSTRRTSLTSQPTSRWTSWVFVPCKKNLFWKSLQVDKLPCRGQWNTWQMRSKASKRWGFLFCLFKPNHIFAFF